jgi:hypothetical protein
VRARRDVGGAAEENVRTISGCDFERIFLRPAHLSRCATVSTRRKWTVLILALLPGAAGERRTETAARSATASPTRPCTLGANGVYDAPRRARSDRLRALECPATGTTSAAAPAGASGCRSEEERGQAAQRAADRRGRPPRHADSPKIVAFAEGRDDVRGRDQDVGFHHGELELRELSELVLESLDLPDEQPAATAAGKEQQ